MAQQGLNAEWRKASASNGTGGNNCVEARITHASVAGKKGPIVQVRDSKDPHGPVLSFTKDEWKAFLSGTSAGEFNLPANT